MVRTQIQLPDELYGRLKDLAAAKEWSLTETIRRAGEAFVQMFPSQPSQGNWSLPQVHLGKPLLPDDKWSETLSQDMEERHLG